MSFPVVKTLPSFSVHSRWNIFACQCITSPKTSKLISFAKNEKHTNNWIKLVNLII